MHSIQYSTFLGLHIYSFFKELEQLVYFMFLKTAHLGKTSETALVPALGRALQQRLPT